MTIKKESAGAWTRLQVAGALDREGWPQLRKFLQAEMESGNLDVEVDLQAVDFLGSTAISELTEFHKVFSGRGGRLRLANLNPHLRDVFRAIHLDKVFSV